MKRGLLNMPSKRPPAREGRSSAKSQLPIKDQPPAKKPSRKLSTGAKVKIAILALLVLAATIYVIWDAVTSGPLTRLFQNRDELVAYIKTKGVLAPIVYVLLQIAQTVFAPIPGNIVGGVGGFLFGWWGILWTLIGSMIGFWIVFVLSRRFGRPLVEKVIQRENLEKFDFIIGKRAPVVLFVIFLIPGLPDDIVAYIAGLTEVKIKNLVLLAIIGRLPSIVVTNYIGMGLGVGNVRLIGLITLGVALVLAVIVWQRERIMRWIHKLGNSTPSDSSSQSKPPQSSSRQNSSSQSPTSFQNPLDRDQPSQKG